MNSLNKLPVDDNFINEEEIALNEIFHTLWIKKWFIAKTASFLTLVAVLGVFQLTPQYTANTKLLVGIDSEKVVDIEAVLSNGLTGDAGVITEVEVIQSRELAHRVINKLHLEEKEEFNSALMEPGFLSQFSIKSLFPEDWLEVLGLIDSEEMSEEEKQQTLSTNITNTFLKKLKVSEVDRSNIIKVSYESEDSKLAAKITNEIADQYILGQLQAKFDATKKATDWLNVQLKDLKIKVELSEQAVEIFRKEKGLLEVSKERGLSQQQLSEINSQLIIARAERAGAQAKYDQVARILKSGHNIESVSAVLNSQLIQRLREQEAEVQHRYFQMHVEYGKKHPRMIQMNAKVEGIKLKITAEVQKIAASLKNSLAVSLSREASISFSLKQIEEKSRVNKQSEVQLRALEREAQANRTLFETFLGRFKETTSTQGIGQADARVISFAEPPLEASFPKKKLLLAVSGLGALFFSAILVFIIEMLNSGIRSPEQVRELLKMSTLGVVPKINDVPKLHQYILDKPQSNLAEAINALRISLSILNLDEQVKTVLLTSFVAREGKSTLSLLVSRQSAKAGRRVVIVDADFRRPAIGRELDIEGKKGFSDLLVHNELDLKDVLIKDEETGLMILTHGLTSFLNPTDLFSSQRMGIILENLKAQFDLVVIDTPPIMAVPDARVLSALVDKVIFVLAWDKTPRKVALSTLHRLQGEKHINIAGAVLQQVNLKQYGQYGSGDSGYYHYYTKDDQYYVS